MDKPWSKPQYDIWGNSVNVASRMDSTGVLDKIQVRERWREMERGGRDSESDGLERGEKHFE